MISAAQARNLLFSTGYPPDKITDIFSGRFTATQSSFAGLGHRTQFSRDHGYGKTAYLQMIYSRDGITWFDQHVTKPDLTAPSAPIFQTIEVGCYCTSSKIFVVASNYTTTAEVIDFVVAAFWKD